MNPKDRETLSTQPEIIESSPTYFWSSRWQAGEREAQEDIDNGRIFRFDNIDEALDFLDGTIRWQSLAK